MIGRTCLTWLCAGAALVGGFSTAEATDQLAWQWEGKEHRYLVRSQVRLSQIFRFRAMNNAEVRITEYQLNFITTCKAVSPNGKKAWELRCTLDDVSIRAAPQTTDADLLPPILQEFDENFTGAFAQIVFTNDGRIRNLDLEGVDKRNRRISQVHDSMRILLTRAFAGLDLQLPRKGDDGGGAWPQKTTLAMGFPSSQGTVGSANVNHEVSTADGAVVEIVSQGEGVMVDGADIDDANGTILNQYRMTLRSWAKFDTAQGILLEREYVVEALPTASSVQADGYAGRPYVQMMRVAYLPPDAPLPDLGPSEALQSEVFPTATQQRD